MSFTSFLSFFVDYRINCRDLDSKSWKMCWVSSGCRNKERNRFVEKIIGSNIRTNLSKHIRIRPCCICTIPVQPHICFPFLTNYFIFLIKKMIKYLSGMVQCLMGHNSSWHNGIVTCVFYCTKFRIGIFAPSYFNISLLLSFIYFYVIILLSLCYLLLNRN